MANNGIIRSSIVDDNGAPIASVMWESPKGSSPYFGWMGTEGFSTVRIESIQAIWPNAQRRDQYVMLLKTGAQMFIGSEDAFRLMKRMGWTDGCAPKA